MKISVHNIDVNYNSHGEGHPILMLHGYWLDHHAMLGTMEPILAGQSGWQRIYLDLPGMGQTPAADWITSSDDMLTVLDGFVEAVLGERPFAIAGLSYGGYLARGLCHRRPQQVSGFLIYAPVIDRLQPDPHLPEHQIMVKDAAVLAQLPPALQPQMEATMVVQDAYAFSRLAPEFGIGLQQANAPFLTHIRENAYHFSFDPDAFTTPYTKPILIITGRQDAIVGYWRAAKLSTQYPHATYVALDRAGHGLSLEQETLFNTLVTDWLHRLQESLTNIPYTTRAQRTLQATITIPAPVSDVWQAWTTTAGATRFFAPRAHIEPHVGGAYELYFDLTAPTGQQGSEGMRILAFQPEQFLSFTWNAPPHLNEVRGQQTAVALHFIPLPNGHTHLTLHHTGWGRGPQWDAAYHYFAHAWQQIVLPNCRQALTPA